MTYVSLCLYNSIISLCPRQPETHTTVTDLWKCILTIYSFLRERNMLHVSSSKLLSLYNPNTVTTAPSGDCALLSGTVSYYCCDATCSLPLCCSCLWYRPSSCCSSFLALNIAPSDIRCPSLASWHRCWLSAGNEKQRKSYTTK